MKLVRLPGLVDVHVHLRDPGATHKEDWESGTAAALAGGFTTLLAMPNTTPAITRKDTLAQSLQAAGHKARCDFAQFLGGNARNAQAAAALAGQAAGLKLYLDQTYGDLKLDDPDAWEGHFASWPQDRPLAVHAEGETLIAAIELAERLGRPLHLCHVSRRDEIEAIRAAKQRGQALTCEVAPHHLFLTAEDIPSLGAGRAEVRPRLASKADQQALWDNLDVIDCFASDHAPHTLAEKDGENPPPGYPGLETTLPLLLTAVSEGRLTLEDVVTRLYENPRRIFGLPEQSETYLEVDLAAQYEIRGANQHTRCGWTPFEGWRVKGRLLHTVLRGQTAYADGRVLATPGSGRNIRNLEDR